MPTYSFLKQIIRDRIKCLEGKEFQLLVWDILRNYCPNLQTPKMVHDKGSDGYCLDGGRFFACYAPEKYINQETASKIASDYNKFEKNWKAKFSFKEWIFITKDDLQGVPHQKLVELNNNKDGIYKYNYGLEKLLSLSLELGPAKCYDIYNIPPLTFEEKEKNETEDMGIIQDIMKFIFEDKISQDNESLSSEDNTLIDLKEKIGLNFPNDGMVIHSIFMNNWNRKEYVKKYIEDETERNLESVKALIDFIQEDYRKIKNTNNHYDPIGSIHIFNEIVSRYLPKDKIRNPDYISGAKSIVLYFFELCYIGKRSKLESQLELGF